MSSTASTTPTHDASPPGARMASAAVRLVSNDPVRGGCHLLRFRVPAHVPEAEPGQFAMLSTRHPDFPLLPRPFSILGWERDDSGEQHAEFLIMPVGRGSRLLCSLAEGDEARLVGPLGHSMDAELPSDGVVAVAGGYGIAPFLFLVERWARRSDPRARDTLVIFGARSAERLSLAERLQAAGCRVQLCTDDGSARDGDAESTFTGRVHDALRGHLADGGAKLVLSCGPEPMMEAVGATAQAAGVPARASLETVMGCGYAVCNGCAVAVACDSEADGHTYELACREGTVFDEDRLQWTLL